MSTGLIILLSILGVGIFRMIMAAVFGKIMGGFWKIFAFGLIGYAYQFVMLITNKVTYADVRPEYNFECGTILGVLMVITMVFVIFVL